MVQEILHSNRSTGVGKLKFQATKWTAPNIMPPPPIPRVTGLIRIGALVKGTRSLIPGVHGNTLSDCARTETPCSQKWSIINVATGARAASLIICSLVKVVGRSIYMGTLTS